MVEAPVCRLLVIKTSLPKTIPYLAIPKRMRMAVDFPSSDDEGIRATSTASTAVVDNRPARTAANSELPQVVGDEHLRRSHRHRRCQQHQVLRSEFPTSRSVP